LLLEVRADRDEATAAQVSLNTSSASTLSYQPGEVQGANNSH